MPKIPTLLLLCLAAAPLHAQPTATVPGWQALEDDYARDSGTEGAARAMRAAIPAGMPAPRATAMLVDAGATCRSTPRANTAETCLLHQYSLADGAADDIRWRIELGTVAGTISSLSLDRYVDRHGSN